MDEIPSCIILLRNGKYSCVCGDTFEDREETFDHMSSEYIGFCVKGMKRCDDNTYECLCGKAGMNRMDARWKHFYDNNTKCFLKVFAKKKLYCSICNIQCESNAAYDRHIDTISHNEKINPTKLDLECKTCNIKCLSQPQIRKHLQTKKHKDMVASGKVAEENISLDCEVCKIRCPSQKTMRAHLLTKKHLSKTNAIAPIE
jgi:hypothetical protein